MIGINGSIIHGLLKFPYYLLNEDTIDDFVEEIPISKEMTDKMVRYHKSKRKDKQRAKKRELRQNLLDKLSKPWKRFTKEETPISIVWKGAAIISSIIAIWALFFKDK